MTAHSLSPEQCRQLAARGPCAAILALKGAESPYLRDCLVRQYQGQTLAQVVADLQEDDSVEALSIVAGIGTLVLRPGGTQFSPALLPAATGTMAPSSTTSNVPAAPRSAPDALATERLQTCHTCPRWSDRRCTVAGCACAGLGQADRLFSRCPEGRW